MCSSSTANQRGGCLTFPLCRDATSAYFLRLVVSYLSPLILDLSVFLAASSFGLSSSLLVRLVLLFPCHSSEEREMIWCAKKPPKKQKKKTPCCYHGNCISELSQNSTDMRPPSFVLSPLALLRLKCTSDENEEKEAKRNKGKGCAC